jgi:predicted alpha/beta hydrolase family esterase
MTDFILLPGIGGSGKAHWQSHWERSRENMQRFQPASWNEPDLPDWMETLEQTVAAAKRPCILVAHSLACLLVAHWNAATRLSVEGAFLVSVPDPTSSAFPRAAAGFADVPKGRLSFRSLIVASSNDPFAALQYSRERADQWGSELVVAGALGHVNTASGLGDWPQGMDLLAKFTDKLSASRAGGRKLHA